MLFPSALSETSLRMNGALVLLSTVTALLAVVVGPAVTLYVARRQAVLQAIVLDRQQRIKELRTGFSRFIALLMVVNGERGTRTISHKEATEKLEEAFRLETELGLMLDANLPDHYTLLSNMADARNRVFKDNDAVFDPNRWEEHYDAATMALVRILQTEQERVRKLK